MKFILPESRLSEETATGRECEFRGLMATDCSRCMPTFKVLGPTDWLGSDFVDRIDELSAREPLSQELTVPTAVCRVSRNRLPSAATVRFPDAHLAGQLSVREVGKANGSHDAAVCREQAAREPLNASTPSKTGARRRGRGCNQRLWYDGASSYTGVGMPSARAFN